MLSVIIPSYKDPFLHPTIDSLLDNAEGDVEIIAVLDGYWPEKQLRNDRRIKIVHNGQAHGMRNAINHGVAVAKGEFIMRTDEHCLFSEGYDKKLTETFEDNWIVAPTRYYLDPEKWKIMDLPPVNFCKLLIVGKEQKFSSVAWPERDEQLKNVAIAENMAIQGSVWIMKKSWWDFCIKELQSEGYGTHYQDSHEMVFKTWVRGGKLMLNKNTFHAHKHRSFKRTHHYSGELSRASFNYSRETWENYYNNIIKPRWGI